MGDTEENFNINSVRGRQAIGEAIDTAINVRNGSCAQGGGKLMFGTPRKGKCRDVKVDGLRVK